MAGALLALAFKVVGTAMMMGIFLISARSMSPDGFGQLAVSFNALSFLSVLAVFGQDILLVRSWGEYAATGAHGLARGAFRFSWTIVLSAVLAFWFLTLLVGTLNPVYRFSVAESAAAASFLALQILLLFTAQTGRVIVGFVLSDINRELTWRLVLLAAALCGLWTGFTPTTFYAGASAGLLVAVGVQVAGIRRGFPAAVAEAAHEARRREWIGRAYRLWTSAVLEAAAQYAEVLLLGLLVSPAVAGLYFVAARLANVFAMLASGLHGYTVTHAARLYYTGERAALQALFRSVMTVAVLIALPILLMVAGFGGTVLDLFGRHYTDGYWTLMLLSVGSFSAAMAGPANGMLLTTGHEKLYSRVLLAALLARVALIAWAAPRFGAVGVAGAWAVVNGPVAIGLAVATYRLTGIDLSVCCVLRRPPRSPAPHRSGSVPRPTA